MLEIIEAGQVGKAELLRNMHRFRKRVFQDRMGWPVTVTAGCEVDEFDQPGTVYVLSVDDQGNVVGTWRLRPTTASTMIEGLWPHFLDSLSMTKDAGAWEASRFAVSSLARKGKKSFSQLDVATKEIFCSVVELCLMVGIHSVYALYDVRIIQLLQRLDCVPFATSAIHSLGGCRSQVGVFAPNQGMLARMHRAAGMNRLLVTEDMLSPVLQKRSEECSHGVAQ